MKWRVWITWWVIFFIRYARLFWVNLKKTWRKTDNPSIRIYVNKIENKITFKVKTGYYLELLTPVTILLGSTKNKIIKDENGENSPNFEIAVVVIIHCIVNNDYHQDSRVLYTFVPYKLFGRLLDISPKEILFSKIFDSEFWYIELWFTDQNSKPLEIERKINVTLVINLVVKYKKWCAIQFNLEIKYL